MNSNLNPKLCSTCGGKCCQHMAGIYHPNDFKEEITAEFIKSLLDSEKVAIDWWEGDPREGKDEIASGYYLRPRHVNEPAIKGSWGGVCVNWSKESGCSLSEESRPYQCRKLVPNKKFDCALEEGTDASKQDLAIAWLDYNEQIQKAIELYRN